MQKSSIVVLAFAVLIVALGAFLAFSSPGSQPVSEEAFKNADLTFGKHYALGSEQAPVTIVEFGDFECPSCGAAYPIVKRVLADYPLAVYFVYRHFPLSQHAHARPAALAAEAAGLQGKFWEMYALLYENQSKLKDENLKQYAADLGLDMQRFEQDRNSPALVAIVNADVADATKFQVNATPTFFINGRRFVGAVSYETFKSEIERITQKQAQ